MNDDLKERLTDLAFELKKHHRRYRSSFRNVIIFYIFIIIFVLIYTTIIGYKIQELAEPRTAAALIGSKVIVTPEYGRDLDPAAELLGRILHADSADGVSVSGRFGPGRDRRLGK